MTVGEVMFGLGVFLVGLGVAMWGESRVSLAYLELRKAGYRSTLLGIKKLKRRSK